MPPQEIRTLRDLTWSYDWLGNMTEWNDDAGQFYERSIGDIRNGYGDGDHRPSALYFSADLGGPTSTNRGGYVELEYGEGGNALSMTVHGECGDRLATTCAAPETPYGDPSGGSSSSARSAAAHATCQCKTEQHYQYRWDELNRIAEARRYDRDGTESLPTWKLAVRQRYRYDSANVRTVKQTLESDDTNGDGFGDADGDPQERLTLYVYPGDFERRGLTRDTLTNSYVTAVAKDGVDPTPVAETQYVVGGARVVWKAETEPGRLDGSVTKTARVTVGIGDLIGTTGAVLDLESGELVEASSYYPNGARESYVSNASENDDVIGPEPMGFTGKEGDEEVGLTYFGERYLISRIGRWASPDPLQIHAAGGGEVGNSYHYVSGNLLKGRDPLGLDGVEVRGSTASRSASQRPASHPTTDTEAGKVFVRDLDASLPPELQGTFSVGPEHHLRFGGTDAQRSLAQQDDVAQHWLAAIGELGHTTVVVPVAMLTTANRTIANDMGQNTFRRYDISVDGSDTGLRLRPALTDGGQTGHTTERGDTTYIAYLTVPTLRGRDHTMARNTFSLRGGGATPLLLGAQRQAAISRTLTHEMAMHGRAHALA